MSDKASPQLLNSSEGSSYEDLLSFDRDITFKAAKEAFSAYRLPLNAKEMKELGIIDHDGLYTNLGRLLADQCPHTIKVGVFGKYDPEFIEDRQEFSGSLLRQLSDIYAFIDFRNQTHSDIVGLNRIDTRDYPIIAVREALFNLFIHRDYACDTCAYIRLYEDKLEFVNPGTLPKGMTADDLKLGISICRNPRLLEAFYLLKAAEGYGSGLKRIMDAYKDYERKPLIEISDNFFKITLFNRNVKVLSSKERILKMVKEKGTISRKDAQLLLDASQTGSGRLLREMVAEGLLVLEGKGKNTRYRLVKHKSS